MFRIFRLSELKEIFRVHFLELKRRHWFAEFSKNLIFRKLFEIRKTAANPPIGGFFCLSSV